jgi:hypothetical protein
VVAGARPPDRAIALNRKEKLFQVITLLWLAAVFRNYPSRFSCVYTGSRAAVEGHVFSLFKIQINTPSGWGKLVSVVVMLAAVVVALPHLPGAISGVRSVIPVIQNMLPSKQKGPGMLDSAAQTPGLLDQ